MTQTIIQVGNSLAVTIPKDFARKVNFRPGQKVTVETDEVQQVFTMQPLYLDRTNDQLSPEFLAWLKKFNAKYKNVLQELAKK